MATVNTMVMGSIPIRWNEIFNILISSLLTRKLLGKALRLVPSLNTLLLEFDGSVLMENAVS